MKKAPIALLDCNNFFVSCERLFRPDLANRPVLVLSSNDGCVVARSQEVKDIGVPMGGPYFQIKDIIKDKGITVFSSNFTLYRDLSARVFSIVNNEADLFEKYSIDEAFFTFRDSDYITGALRLRDKIGRELGLPVSIGIAQSKTLAKFAAREAKRGEGTTELTNDSWRLLAPKVPLGELWGVGARRALAFRAQGLLTAADVLGASSQWMHSCFGVEGVRLWHELRGEVAYPIVPMRPVRQSVTHSRSFARSTTVFSVVAAAVSHHLQMAATELAELHLCASKITVFIGGKKGSVVGRVEQQILEPTADPFVLLGVAKGLLQDLYEIGVSYKKAGVVLSGLVPQSGLNKSLFSPQNESAPDTGLADTLKQISLRWGSRAVQIGLADSSRDWDSRHESLSPAYTTRWSEVLRVRCR